MKPISVYNSKIPKALSLFIDITGITLYPFIIYRGSKKEVPEDVHNHEMIHIYQQRELLVIGFYALYVYYWLKNRAKGQDNLHAYANIPFEVEAYRNQHNMEYLSSREKGAWKKYIGQKLIS